MKSVRFLMPFFILAFFLCCSLNVQAQIYDIRPDMPYIDAVSVDPLTNLITISWDMLEPKTPPSPLPEKFVLFWFIPNPTPQNPNAGNNYPFATITNPDDRSYTFDYDIVKSSYPDMPDPRKGSVAFTVTAVMGAAPDEVSSIRSIPPHNNIHVYSRYDSCNSEIRLKWHPYIGRNRGWLANSPPYKPLESYHVMQSVEGGPFEDIKQLTPNDTSYIVSNVNDNKKYQFYIEAKRAVDGLTVTSNLTERITNMPRPPDYIIAVGTKYNSEGLAEVSFKLDDKARTYSYEFYGSSRHEYSFVSLGAFTIRKDTVLTDIQKREKTHYYKLEAWHLCRNRITAISNLATALWLTLKQESTENLLFWDPYLEWKDAQNQKINAKYDVYRKIGDNMEVVIATITDPATTNYRDDLSGILIDGDICYWIIAKPASPNALSLKEQAISNTVCIKPESDIFIPKAFTPDTGGIDGEYKPFFSYPPQEYLFVAYDRIGAKVFETKDIDAGWNGQLMNGKPASEGVYTYFLRFRTAMGRLIEKTGTFVLLRP